MIIIGFIHHFLRNVLNHVVTHTSTHYVKYGKTKALYNFSNVSLFKYFRALVIMPKPLEILFLV